MASFVGCAGVSLVHGVPLATPFSHTLRLPSKDPWLPYIIIHPAGCNIRNPALVKLFNLIRSKQQHVDHAF